MLSRRRFLQLGSRLSAGIVLSTAATGCALRARAPALGAAGFPQGVASGDPLPDGIMLWTRALPAGGTRATVAWELASDPMFRDILRDGSATATSDTDYTVKIDLRDLVPGTDYYYRFRSANAASATGRARTLPVGPVDSVRLAAFSCSNYPAGYFHPYREASRAPGLDAWLHLGDYIYEYGAGGYASEDAARLGRALPADNDGELFTLDDYRRRYALYRSDEDLQAMHAAAPCIAVWDDHELANNAWRDGAQNHQEGEGDFIARRLAAMQAYYEWLPIRPPAGETDLRIYRGFDFGELLSLHMLDTRLIARDRQLDYGEFVDPNSGRMDMERLRRELGSLDRRLLGEEQLAWLAGRMAASPARWQLLGQQVLMGRMHFPAELLARRGEPGSTERLAELVALKQRALAREPLSERDRQRLATVAPYNLDAWDGYPAERERLYGLARRLDKRLVSVAGDTHNAWFNRLSDRHGQDVGVELATASVSSPGMERYLDMTAEQARELAQALPVLVDDLQYCNLHQRGFLLMTAYPERLEAEWRFIDTVKSPRYQVAGVHREVFPAAGRA